MGLLEIAGADHYYRIRSGPWGLNLAYHDPETTDDLMQAVSDWILDWSETSETGLQSRRKIGGLDA